MSIQVDWSQPLQSRDGRPARLFEPDGWQEAVGDQRRRVATCNHNPPCRDDEHKKYTIRLCDDQGRVRGDGAESPRDIINGNGDFTWAFVR